METGPVLVRTVQKAQAHGTERSRGQRREISGAEWSGILRRQSETAHGIRRQVAREL